MSFNKPDLLIFFALEKNETFIDRGDSAGNPHFQGEGEGLLMGDHRADLDKGILNLYPMMFVEGDIFHVDTEGNRIIPVNGAKIVNLGVVDFDAITGEQLTQLTYSTDDISGDQLTNGDVFAVRTSLNFNYAKVKVLEHGSDIELQWVTYSCFPEPQMTVSINSYPPNAANCVQPGGWIYYSFTFTPVLIDEVDGHSSWDLSCDWDPPQYLEAYVDDEMYLCGNGGVGYGSWECEDAYQVSFLENPQDYFQGSGDIGFDVKASTPHSTQLDFGMSGVESEFYLSGEEGEYSHNKYFNFNNQVSVCPSTDLTFNPNHLSQLVCRNHPDEEMTAYITLTNNLDIPISWMNEGYHNLPSTRIEPSNGLLQPHESTQIAVISKADGYPNKPFDQIGTIKLLISDSDGAQIGQIREIPIKIKVRNCRPVPGDGWEAPEFPSAFLPATMIIGFLGVVFYIKRTREH